MVFSPYRSIQDIRAYHFLSYWFVVWFAVYYLIRLWLQRMPEHPWSDMFRYFYRYANPSLSLYFGLVFDMFILSQFMYYGASLGVMTKFILINVVIKIIPLYLLRNIPLLFPHDLYLFIGITLVYFLYLQRIGTNFQTIYKDAFKDTIRGGNHSPVLYLLSQFHV